MCRQCPKLLEGGRGIGIGWKYYQYKLALWAISIGTRLELS